MQDDTLLHVALEYLWSPLVLAVGHLYVALNGLRKKLSDHEIDMAEKIVTRAELQETFKQLREMQREDAREIKAMHNDLSKQFNQLNQTLIQFLAKGKTDD